jgi:predicted nucleotidyltransferase
MAIKERWKGFAELPPDIERKIECLPELFAESDVQLAYLFGSVARQGPGPEPNDVDLAVWVSDSPAYRLRAHIVECLGTERVDLVDLRRASPVLRFEILKAGRPLYVADEAFQERYEMQTIRVYRDTHYLRRRQREYLKERFASWSSNQRPSLYG